MSSMTFVQCEIKGFFFIYLQLLKYLPKYADFKIFFLNKCLIKFKSENNHAFEELSYRNYYLDLYYLIYTGCPKCEKTDSPRQLLNSGMMALDTAQGWRFWCNVQCRQGHGGAACNCDRAPFQQTKRPEDQDTDRPKRTSRPRDALTCLLITFNFY